MKEAESEAGLQETVAELAEQHSGAIEAAAGAVQEFMAKPETQAAAANALEAFKDQLNQLVQK